MPNMITANTDDLCMKVIKRAMSQMSTADNDEKDAEALVNESEVPIGTTSGKIKTKKWKIWAAMIFIGVTIASVTCIGVYYDYNHRIDAQRSDDANATTEYPPSQTTTWTYETTQTTSSPPTKSRTCSGCCGLDHVYDAFPESADVLRFYPPGDRFYRCAGFCSSSQSSEYGCVASSYSMVSVEVQAYYLNGTSGPQIINMENHEACSCGCQRKNCTKGQVFSELSCKCHCPNRLDCPEKENKVWDEVTCSCACIDHHHCTTGSKFDSRKCECVRDSAIT